MKRIMIGACTEGNGHLTQAIALKENLTDDYEIVKIAVPKKKKGLPKYFKDEFSNISLYHSFDFAFNKDGRMCVWKTAIVNLFKLPKIIFSIIRLIYIIKKTKPDIIVNFFDPIIGISSLFTSRKIKHYAYGHQYAMQLSAYPKIKGFFIQKFFLRILNFITSLRAERLALSYYPIETNKVKVIPPILRKESYITSDKKENFVLCYLIDEGMINDLINQARKYPNINIECFTKLTKKFDPPENLKLFNVDAKLFQEKMKVCKAVLCTGGFETSSEAILQGKPLLMVPLPNHFEQFANSNDAEKAGYATFSREIDLSKLPETQIDAEDWFKYNREINYL